MRNKLAMKRAAESFDSLIALIEGSSFLYFSHKIEGDGVPSYYLTIKGLGASTDLASDSLAKILMQALRPLKIEPPKRCSRCRKSKKLTEFNLKPSAKDGRASHCAECDRKRKKKWYPRAARRASRSAATNGSFQAAQQQLEV